MVCTFPFYNIQKILISLSPNVWLHVMSKLQLSNWREEILSPVPTGMKLVSALIVLQPTHHRCFEYGHRKNTFSTLLYKQVSNDMLSLARRACLSKMWTGVVP
jgi:hypothetical protein